MKDQHFQIYLATDFDLNVAHRRDDGEILEGKLTSRKTGAVTPVISGVPRFAPRDNYTKNFGFQWNQFRATQLDSKTGLPLTANRFWANTKWTPDELRGKLVLEVGSGAGRFSEILLQAGAHVVSFDYSDAVDANWTNNSGGGDIFIFQASLYDLPLAPASFDFVFCYGVLQHTPDPDTAYRAIESFVKPGGKISIDYYRRSLRPSPWSTPKYLWRPLTTRLPPELLARVVKWYVPRYLPIDTIIRRIPRFGAQMCSLIPIPCWNYLGLGLGEQQRIEWAVLDTFDALSAAYDKPKTRAEVTRMIFSADNDYAEVFYGSNGIVANVRKKSAGMEGQSHP
jgi:SAM-dependent methyltransferase